MGGSIHGGAVMSFIDMAMFAGGRCAGMARGHYVTLDLTTHFLARGKAGHAARRACRAGPADARPRLPAGRRPAGRRALLQLHRHAQAREHAPTDPRHDRPGRAAPMPRWSRRASSSPIRRRRAPSPRSTGWRHRCSERDGLLDRLLGKRRTGLRRRLSVGRGRARQVDADGPRLRPYRRRARSAGSISTRSCSKPTSGCARRAKSEEGDPIDAGRRADRRRSAGCSRSTRCRSTTRPTR